MGGGGGVKNKPKYNISRHHAVQNNAKKSTWAWFWVKFRLILQVDQPLWLLIAKDKMITLALLSRHHDYLLVDATM